MSDHANNAPAFVTKLLAPLPKGEEAASSKRFRDEVVAAQTMADWNVTKKRAMDAFVILLVRRALCDPDVIDEWALLPAPTLRDFRQRETLTRWYRNALENVA